jgi:LTXXQ motif family protein
MRKVALFIAAAAVIASASFAGSASAQGHRDRADRAALTADQIAAEDDVRTARIKADLRLTADQEKNWSGFESALHDIGKTRAERLVALRADRGQHKESSDVIAYLNSRATFFSDRSADMKKLADAAQPLYASLDDQQKNRFANQLMRFTRE